MKKLIVLIMCLMFLVCGCTKDTKFHYKDKVKIVVGFYKGYEGTVYTHSDESYSVYIEANDDRFYITENSNNLKLIAVYGGEITPKVVNQ